MDPVELNEPVAGSYSSADASCPRWRSVTRPPAIRTLPLASKVAVWLLEGAVIDPVAVNESVLGSYSSADAIG